MHRLSSVQEARRQHNLLARAAARIRNLYLHAAFEAWWEAVHAVATARASAEHACAKLHARMLANAFATWQESAEALCTARAKVARVVLHMQQCTLAKAFQSWHCAAEQVRSARKAACRQLCKVIAVDLRLVRSSTRADAWQGEHCRSVLCIRGRFIPRCRNFRPPLVRSCQCGKCQSNNAFRCRW